MRYQLAIDAMAALPGSAGDMAKAAGMGRAWAYQVAKQLRRAGLIEFSHHVKEGRFVYTHYKLADGTPDLKMRAPLCDQMQVLHKLWRLLAEPMSTRTLCKRSGVGERTVHKLILKMRKAGLVHIAEWEFERAHWHAEYMRGRKKDMPKPKPMTRLELGRRYREGVRNRKLMQAITGIAA